MNTTYAVEVSSVFMILSLHHVCLLGAIYESWKSADFINTLSSQYIPDYHYNIEDYMKVWYKKYMGLER